VKSPLIWETELERANGNGHQKTVAEFMKDAGVDALKEDSTPEETSAAITKFFNLTVSLDPVLRMVAQSHLAKKLKGLKLPGASDLVKQAFRTPSENKGNGAGQGVAFNDPEPWPEEVNGAELLDEIKGTIERFCVMSPDASAAISLWVAFAWGHQAFSVSPLLNLTSPTKRCGKSTVLRLVSKLAPRPLVAANISMPALFRTIEMYTPTLLIDEVDVFLKWDDQIQGLLNAGHELDTAFCIRCEGESLEPKPFRIWGPKVIAGIGKRKDTLEDRSITIELRRKTKEEKVERLVAGALEPSATLRQKLARWSEDNLDILKSADPKIPEQLNDRACDNWRGLLAIADLAGGGLAIAGPTRSVDDFKRRGGG